MRWDFSAAEGVERLDSIDVQAFRLLVTDCETEVSIRQTGTTGILRDLRAIRLNDGSVATLSTNTPALTLAHSGVGTFETAGAMRRLFFQNPEDWISGDLGPVTAPEFIKYAFLDGTSYFGGGARRQFRGTNLIDRYADTASGGMVRKPLPFHIRKQG